MRVTTVLSLRALASRVHNTPLPLSKKESQQLLNLLSSSFNRHLDRHHPVLRSDESKASSPKRDQPTQSDLVSPSLKLMPPSARLSTAVHLLEILQHPLNKGKPKSLPTKSTSSDLQADQALPWLEARFASGHATKQDILRFLESLCGAWSLKASSSRIVSLRKLQASRLLEAWLFPEDVARVEDLYCNNVLRGLWIKLLVIEGRQDAIEASLLSMKAANDQARIFTTYIAAEAAHGGGLKSACQKFVNLKSRTPTLSTRQAVRPIMSRLSRESQSIPAELYDQMLPLLRTDTGYEGFNEAAFTLFHPSDPTSDHAYKFFNSLQDEAAVDRYTNKTAPRHLMISMSLRLAHLLIDNGRLARAQEILHFTQKHFPEALGAKEDVAKPTPVVKEARVNEEERKFIEFLEAGLAT